MKSSKTSQLKGSKWINAYFRKVNTLRNLWTSHSKIHHTWKRLVSTQSSWWPCKFLVTFNPLANCKVASFWIMILMFSWVYGRELSQQASASGFISTKNKFPSLSIAWTVFCSTVKNCCQLSSMRWLTWSLNAASTKLSKSPRLSICIRLPNARIVDDAKWNNVLVAGCQTVKVKCSLVLPVKAARQRIASVIGGLFWRKC